MVIFTVKWKGKELFIPMLTPAKSTVEGWPYYFVHARQTGKLYAFTSEGRARASYSGERQDEVTGRTYLGLDEMFEWSEGRTDKAVSADDINWFFDLLTVFFGDCPEGLPEGWRPAEGLLWRLSKVLGDEYVRTERARFLAQHPEHEPVPERVPKPDVEANELLQDPKLKEEVREALRYFDESLCIDCS